MTSFALARVFTSRKTQVGVTHYLISLISSLDCAMFAQRYQHYVHAVMFTVVAWLC